MHPSFPRSPRSSGGIWRTALAAVVATLFAATASTGAPAALRSVDEEFAILVMAHGGSDDWNQIVTDAVTALPSGRSSTLAFGMADRATLQQAIVRLTNRGVQRIVVVRLFVSAESFLPQTEWLLGLRAERPDFVVDSDDPDGVARRPIEHNAKIVLSKLGLADAAAIGDILVQRALELSRVPTTETVLLLAHGMGSEKTNDRLLASMDSRAATVREAAPFRRVVAETYREDWEEPRTAARERIRDLVRTANLDGTVLVLPFRLAQFGPYAEVLEGLEYVGHPKGLLPHPAIAEWIVATSEEEALRMGWSTKE